MMILNEELYSEYEKRLVNILNTRKYGDIFNNAAFNTVTKENIIITIKYEILHAIYEERINNDLNSFARIIEILMGCICEDDSCDNIKVFETIVSGINALVDDISSYISTDIIDHIVRVKKLFDLSPELKSLIDNDYIFEDEKMDILFI